MDQRNRHGVADRINVPQGLIAYDAASALVPNLVSVVIVSREKRKEIPIR